MSAPNKVRSRWLQNLTPEAAARIKWDWSFWARPNQLAPSGDWRTWLVLAGRGFGKTKLGSEWVRSLVETKRARRIALVAPTAADARDVMVEGASGILNVCPPWCKPIYEPSKRRIVWPNGAIATTYSAEEPDRLRGPQHDFAFCFLGNTQITLSNGQTKEIQAIQAGDSVLTRDGARKVLVSRRTQESAKVYQLTLSDGRSIVGTAEHPIFCRGKWIPLAMLQPGDLLCALASKRAPGLIAIRVRSVTPLYTTHPVYDLTVEGAHEFFANGILVHNCDEIAAWRYPETWDQLRFGLRLGTNPQTLVTTTPRPTELIRNLARDKSTVVTKGTTYDNYENLAEGFFEDIIARYEGTRIGRQEIYADILDDLPGALWQRSNIDKYRVIDAPSSLAQIVVGVDPAVTSGESSNETGIIVAAIGTNHQGYVLDDYSCKDTPDGWARRVVKAYKEYKADYIVAEVNNGGDLVESIIRTIDPNVRYKKVHASRGKVVRAEPVAALYEQGKIHHVGTLAALEDQMCLYTPLDYPGSPDRVDALCWVFTEIMLSKSQHFDYSRFRPPAGGHQVPDRLV